MVTYMKIMCEKFFHLDAVVIQSRNVKVFYFPSKVWFGRQLKLVREHNSMLHF